MNYRQLGVPTNSAEKLKAIKSKMGDFVEKLAKAPFISKTNVTARRYGKLQLCAQICINSISKNSKQSFSNAKYEDLRDFYREHYNFNEKSKDALRILNTLNKMGEIFGNEASYFRSRANTVSAYLFVEELMQSGKLDERLVKEFFLNLLEELRKEIRKGIYAGNEVLLNYYSRIIQASDTKSSIEARDKILKDLFEYFKKHKKIKFSKISR